jgi:dihydropteroate synthase
MTERPRLTLRFADGAQLELGEITRVMGVLNATPDSFSDGGRHPTVPAALEAARGMVDGGADFIDVGGESTRPGATPVPAEEEIARVIPVIEGIRRFSDVRISVDTMKTEVARRALDVGADVINDVSAFGDVGMLELVRDRQVPVVLMHMRGEPRTMQRDTHYDDLVTAVAGFLADRAAGAIAGGVAGDRIILDPGLGFGKSATGNLTLLRDLTQLRPLGYPILIGASRKSFIGKTLGLPVDERAEAGLAIASYASARGAHIIRTHDVEVTQRAVRMIDAIREV